MKYNYQTLHAHTTASDGELEYSQMLLECEKYGFEVVAFTDHDTLISSKNIKLLQKIKSEVKWISGVEVSSGWPADLGGGATSGLHIVGLFVNPFDKALLDHCKNASEARISRMQKIVKNLKGLGFIISEKDCLKASNGESVGRPHIVRALTYNRKNNSVVKRIISKMRRESLADSMLKERYDYMIERGEDQYPYMLFLSEDAYIKNIYVDYQYYVDLDTTVKLIRDAGGLSILAHWGTCRNKLDDSYLDRLLRDNRLDGAEVVYGLWNYKMAKWSQQENELKIITNIVNKNNKLKSGGADAHTGEDLQEFSVAKWFSEKTVGLVEEVIKQSKVDINWSSIK